MATEAPPSWTRARRLLIAASGVFALACASRVLGFGDGLLLGATPASALALGAAVLLRGPGAAAAGLGFVLADLAWGFGLPLALLDGLAHGLAALLGSTLMRGFARRRVARSRTSDWLIFLAGVAAFTITVAMVYAAGGGLGLLGPWPAAAAVPALALVYQPLGLFTFGATLASLGEARRILADPRPAIGIALLAAMLIGVLWVLLALPSDAVSPSGVTLLLSIPFCLWISMQRRSLDGAAISFVAAHVALALLIADAGAIDHVEFVTGLLYLNALVAICQLVHAVNLDRLGALAEVEAQKAELERRVVERTARLHAMAEAALAADASKTRFLATVSHEVRTPLAGVIGMAGVVLAEELEPRTRRYVEIIRTSGHHLLDVINRILDYARRDAPLREGDFVGFDLAELVDEVLVEAGFLPYAEGIALRAEIAPGLPLARRGYRHGLRQVLTNLVGNAAKFTEAGSVTVRLAALPGLAVRIEVEDTGVGIPPELHDRIFEPFEQGEGSAARRHGGTGLGLAISADVVERLGGRIGLTSAPGRGTLFWVEVPLALAAPGGRPVEAASA